MRKKSVDKCFMQYGIRTEDMELIERYCRDECIDADWLREYILEPYKNLSNQEGGIDDRKIKSIINKALKQIK